jgi:hypothetical protein
LVRIFGGELLGWGEANCVQQLYHLVLARAALQPFVDGQRARQVMPNRLDRIQGTEWVLEDHLHVVAVAQHGPPVLMG